MNEIVLGKRGISADTALRLSRFFGTTAEFWMNLQMRYDLETRRALLGRRPEREVEALRRRVAPDTGFGVGCGIARGSRSVRVRNAQRTAHSA